MFKNRSALTIKATFSAQAVFKGFPKNFDDVDLYTPGGLAVNFVRELILPVGVRPFRKQTRGRPRAVEGVIY